MLPNVTCIIILTHGGVERTQKVAEEKRILYIYLENKKLKNH